MRDGEQLKIGGKIRRLRRQRHITQADLAAALGISPSYLNLIEHNRRNVNVSLLLTIAGYFGVEAGELAESDDARLAGDLMEVFGDEAFADEDLTNQDIREFARTNPVVARTVLRLFDKYRDYRERGQVGMNTETAERVFHRATDSISDFIQEHANHFPEIEKAAERVRHDIDNSSEVFEIGFRAWLQNVFGMEWRYVSLPHGMALRLGNHGRVLEVSELLSVESALFAVAHHMAHHVAQGAINDIVDARFSEDSDAPALARNVLASYFAAALIMPYQPFLRACRETRYDIERLMRRFTASFEQVCHRMTTLQRPGAQGIPLHLIRTDIAGNISKRFSLSGIHIPRHAGACPRWNVYSAFLQPGQINVQISRMPNGDTFFCIAHAFEKGGHRYNSVRRHMSIGIGCDIAFARQMVYSDGVDLTNESLSVPVGVSCRICPRMDCEHRAHPPANHRFRIEDDLMAESIYGHMR